MENSFITMTTLTTIKVIIEIPMFSQFPVKYEYNKEMGMLWVDRFISAAVQYPCNYGYIPDTIGGDGDPIDVLLVSSYPVQSGAGINCRPIGALRMSDESGEDTKIIAVPDQKVDEMLASVMDITDINEVIKSRITHFFKTYKDLEKNKWVQVGGYENRDFAIKLITDSYTINQNSR